MLHRGSETVDEGRISLPILRNNSTTVFSGEDQDLLKESYTKEILP